MATLRNLVSTVRSSHKLLSTDGSLTDRAVAAEIKNSTFLLIKREANLRKLWNTDTVFTTIQCLDMQQVPISECCDYVDPCMVSRTKLKLPRISEGNYQYLIQGVWSINAMGGASTKFDYVTINRYTNLLKLPIVKNGAYFWIVNNYLYTNNPNIKAIRLAAYFEEDVPNEMLFGEECCGQKVSDEEWCKNPLDREFALPGYLEKQVLELVSQKLLNTYFRLKSDLTNDGVDGQSPNTKPTN